jgi:hypothetical protein
MPGNFNSAEAPRADKHVQLVRWAIIDEYEPPFLLADYLVRSGLGVPAAEPAESQRRSITDKILNDFPESDQFVGRLSAISPFFNRACDGEPL